MKTTPAMQAVTAKRKQVKPRIHVVFDSNAIFFQSDKFLLPKRVSELILGHRDKTMVELAWVIPELVLQERRYQMSQLLQRHLAQVKKLEKRLDKKTSLSTRLIDQTIRKDTSEQCKAHGVLIAKCRYSSVDLKSIVHNAVHRLPPFEETTIDDIEGEKERKSEKGFRDAIIAETFYQYAKGFVPQTEKCRLFFVTADGLLAKAVAKEMNPWPHVIVIGSDGGVNSYINTIASHIEDELVSRLLDFATLAFKWTNDVGSFASSDAIWKSMLSQFGKELNAMPVGAEKRVNKTAAISRPEFNKKEGDRLSIKSRLTVGSEATKDEFRWLPTEKTPWLSALAGINSDEALVIPSSAVGAENSPAWLRPIASTTKFEQVETLVGRGTSIFDIHWSVQHTHDDTFVDPRVDGIKHVETTWKMELPSLTLLASGGANPVLRLQ